MATFAQFRTAVQGFYNPGAVMDILVYQAVSCYVKSRIEKEVNQDLERSKSYMNEYLSLKVKLAGSTIAPNFAAVKAVVVVRITVDSQRTAISTYVDQYIQEGMDDLNAAKLIFDSFLKECCVDIQRKVMCYQQNNQAYYIASQVTNTGFASKIDLTTLAGVEILGVSVGRYYAPLAAQAYTAGDYVQSNGRIYKTVTTGVVAVVGTGLASTDGSDETLGTAVFQFLETIAWRPAYPVHWLARDLLLDRTLPGAGPAYTIDPPVSNLYVYPPLSSTDTYPHQIRVEYNGLKTAFADVDTVTFDFPCQSVAADFVKGRMLWSVSGETQLAQASLLSYSAGLRRLWTDCSRKQSTSLSK